jgi:SAM-dependent methyltransferase
VNDAALPCRVVLPASAERLTDRLSPSDVVLDIGGWADPFPRADWVIDAMPYETRGLYEREGWVNPRPPEPERFDASRWIQRDLCDREPYPFEDGAIDFVVCSQTLEDVRDPVWICAEMIRVAKAGYIEVPSRLEEQTYGVEAPCVGWRHHHWLVDVGEGSIEFAFKPHDLHARPDCHFPDGFDERLRAEERVQTLWWEGGFAYRERLFIDESPYDDYLPRLVAEGLRERAIPARRDGRRDRLRRLGRRGRPD